MIFFPCAAWLYVVAASLPRMLFVYDLYRYALAAFENYRSPSDAAAARVPFGAGFRFMMTGRSYEGLCAFCYFSPGVSYALFVMSAAIRRREAATDGCRAIY